MQCIRIQGLQLAAPLSYYRTHKAAIIKIVPVLYRYNNKSAVLYIYIHCAVYSILTVQATKIVLVLVSPLPHTAPPLLMIYIYIYIYIYIMFSVKCHTVIVHRTVHKHSTLRCGVMCWDLQSQPSTQSVQHQPRKPTRSQHSSNVGICLRIYCGAIRTSDQQRDLNSASRLRLNSCIIFGFTPTGLYISSGQGHLL